MELNINPIIKNKLKTLHEKINLELDDVICHMKENSFKSFSDIKDKIYLKKWENFHEMMKEFHVLNCSFKKIYGCNYFDLCD